MQPIQQINYTIYDEADWTVTYGYKGYGYVIRRPNGSVACTMPEGLRSEDRALADFVSAAPELFAVVSEFVQRCDELGIQDFNMKLLPQARAAIAKATGN